MKVVIFGASGGTGRLLVEQALAQNYTVTAFVRNPTKLDLNQPNLNMVQGDVLNSSAVKAALAGQEAVMIALGAPEFPKATTIRADGTKNIIGAMQQTGVRRLICLSTFGAAETRKALPFLYRYIVGPLILSGVFADSERQEAHIKQSGLDWTIVRPVKLTDGEPVGSYQQGFSKLGKDFKLKIARADVADFMLKQLKSTSYLHQTPALSY